MIRFALLLCGNAVSLISTCCSDFPKDASQFSQPMAVLSQNIGSRASLPPSKLPSDLSVNIEALQAALQQLEAAASLSTQGPVDFGSLNFLLTTAEVRASLFFPMPFSPFTMQTNLELVCQQLGLESLSEEPFLAVAEQLFLTCATELTFSRVSALTLCFLTPRLRSLQSQPSRSLMAFVGSLAQAHQDALVESCLVPLGCTGTGSEKMTPYLADFVLKTLGDSTIASAQVEKFVQLVLESSAKSSLVWREAHFDMLARVVALPKMKFTTGILISFGLELRRQQQNNDFNPAHFGPRIVVAVNEFCKRAAPILQNLPETVQVLLSLMRTLPAPAALLNRLESLASTNMET